MPMGFGSGAGMFKPPRLGIIKRTGVGKQVRANMPKSAGSPDTNYIAGHNPRQMHYTSSPGTKPKAFGGGEHFGSATAPHKFEAPIPSSFKLEGFK